MPLVWVPRSFNGKPLTNRFSFATVIEVGFQLFALFRDFFTSSPRIGYIVATLPQISFPWVYFGFVRVMRLRPWNYLLELQSETSSRLARCFVQFRMSPLVAKDSFWTVDCTWGTKVGENPTYGVSLTVALSLVVSRREANHCSSDIDHGVFYAALTFCTAAQTHA